MIDHLGVGVADLAEAAVAYERLGFNLTPYARHEGATVPGVPSLPLATANRCAMFERGYIELISVVNPNLPDNGLGLRIQRAEGIHITAFTTSDIDGTVAQLRAAGLDAQGPIYLERTAATEDGSALARFDRVVVPDEAMPDTRSFYIKHLTPEVLWQRRHLDHKNGTVGVVGVTFAVEDLQPLVQRLEKFLGVRVTRGTFSRDGSAVTVMHRSDATARFKELMTSGPLVAVAMTLSVLSLERLRQHLEASGVPHIANRDEVLVGPQYASGAILAFVEHDAMQPEKNHSGERLHE